MFKAHSPHLLLSAAAAILLTTTSIVELPRGILFRFGAICQRRRSDPDRPIRGGLSRLACGAVLLSPIDRGSPNLLGVRDGLRFFTRWVGKLLGSFPYAQNPQAFAHRLALAVRA
jgi:hypothetical protein